MVNKLLDDDYDNYFNEQSYTTKRSNDFDLSLVEKMSSENDDIRSMCLLSTANVSE